MPSSRTTRHARTRSCGPTSRAVSRSSASRPTTRTRRPSGSRARSEALIGGRGTELTRRADESDEDTSFRARDIAVMYRMNAQSRAIEESFLRYGLRYQLIGGTRFYARREVKDALAYLRVLRSDTDSVSFERIINVPARSIGDKTIEALRAAAAATDGETGEPGTYWGAIERGARGDIPTLAPRTRNALAEFAGLIRRLRTRIGVLPLPELLDEVLEASGYRAMLADGSEDGEDRWANLLELRSVTTRYDDLEPEDALDRLLEETALVADQDSVRGGRRRRHADHAPCGEGPRVPGRLHRRPGRGPLPAQPRARRRTRARGGAAAGLRRDHTREAAAVPVACLATRDVGDGAGVGPVAVPDRDPRRPDDRPAPRWHRRAGARSGPRPRVRAAPHDPVQHADPWAGPGLSTRKRATRCSERGRVVPTEPRPRGQARGVRGRGSIRIARRPIGDRRRRLDRHVRSSRGSVSTATAIASAMDAGAMGSW